jgi:choline dehydrogenase-like flavoprotein
MSQFDVIIIGAGAGGGAAGGVLVEAGKRVLLLERGQELSFEAVGRDHLRNQRLSQYGLNAGPEISGNPRVFQDYTDPYSETVVPPKDGRYHANAACVGSGTRVYGAQAWRFMPQDFRMASIYGIPKGSSLADWPISYDELAPYYERAEWEIGVAGDASQMKHLPMYNNSYPMPAMRPNLQGQTVRRGAAALGWHSFPIPLLINSVEYNGRPACIGCQHCVGFACPVDAKNGTQNTMIARALASGSCRLVTEAMVGRITVSEAGRVTGVTYFSREGTQVEVTADVVVVSAGAIESARLLLNSTSPQEPRGLGNNSDQVGRHLQGHYYPGAIGLFPEAVQDGIGPGATTAMCEFNHDNDGIIGGGMLADDFIVLPITFWKRKLPPDLPRWGAANKAFMRENYRKVADITGPVQEIPSPESRVTISSTRDQWGIPVARLSGTTHPETVHTAAFMNARAREWLKGAGAIKVWGDPPPLRLSAGQHQAGTCRMGDDPQLSVVDRWGRVHGHDNLFVADGSVHVTNGGFNPVLTILALAFRTAEHIAQTW